VIAPGTGFEQAARIDRVRARHHDYFSVSGNLGANLFLLDPLTLRLNVGTAVRPPVPGKFSVFVPAGGSSPGRVGNPALAAERSLNAEVGGRLAGRTTTVDTTAFATTIFGYMAEHESLALRDPANAGFRYRTFGNQDALLYGVELGIRQVVLGRYLVLLGTVSYAAGSFLAPIPDCSSDDTDLPLVPPVRGFVAMRSRPLSSLHIELRARYAAAQRRSSEVAGERPTPMYGLLDLRVDYTFRRLWSLEDVSLYVNVLNLTDARYKEHTAQYTGVAVGFEEAYLQPGIDVRAGLSLRL
jgi:outer membrane receptor protein involved in Fe transport